MSGGFRQSRYRADLQEMACPSACNWPPVPDAGSYCCKPRRSRNKRQNGTRRCRDWRRPRRDGQIRPSSRATFGQLECSPQLTLLEVCERNRGTTVSALLTLVVAGWWRSIVFTFVRRRIKIYFWHVVSVSNESR